MKRTCVDGPRLLATVGGVVALLCVSLTDPTAAAVAPQTRHLHTVAYRTDHHDDDGVGNNGGSGPLDSARGGLAKTVNGVALLAPPPIRPGTAKRTGSTPIDSHAARPGVTKPTPHLVGARSGVAGTSIGQNGPLSVAVAGPVVITQNGPLTIGAGETWTASAICPSSGQATSGGESNSSSAGVVLNQSYAYGDGSGWIVEVRNQSNTSAVFTVYAMCTAGLTGYRTVNSNITLDPGRPGEVTAACPDGTSVRGVGEQAGVDSGIGLLQVEPAFRSDEPPNGQVRIQVTNLDTRIGQFAAQAICAASGSQIVGTEGGGGPLPPNGYAKTTGPNTNTPQQAIVSAGGGCEPQVPCYLTDIYPDTQNGFPAWSTWVRNTSSTETNTEATVYLATT